MLEPIAATDANRHRDFNATDVCLIILSVIATCVSSGF
jgi:hypothetical protein